MRDLTPEECEFIAGGLKPQSIATSTPENPPIVVVAWPPPPPYFPPPPPPPPPPYYPPPSGGGGGGGGSSGNGATDMDYTKDCSTPGQTADGIRDTIVGPMPPDTSVPNWTNTEFGALITQDATGKFGAYNDTIYTDGYVNQATIPLAPTSTVVAGLIHNHPDALGGAYVDLQQRYPSPDDWLRLEEVYNRYNHGNTSYNPSLWIIDSNGALREFKYSDRSYYEGLSPSQRAAGEGLPAESTEQSCGG